MDKLTAALHLKPGRSPANRSLERGIEILRAFRAGAELLGNGELAERTGLSRSTVSRLAHTLAGTGLLQLDLAQRAYRLGVPVLSLAHAMRTGSSLLARAAPLMRALSEAHRVNVGLAAADRDEMVYLESIRYNRRASLRTIASGQRIPMELTSLGRAHLAVAPEAQRKALLAIFKRRRGTEWPALARQIDEAIASVARQRWCVASWQPEVVAVATPIVLEDGTLYALNVSVATATAPGTMARELKGPLLELADDIAHAHAAP
jgi:DNA-binding IclR family transcriptional regulator